MNKPSARLAVKFFTPQEKLTQLTYTNVIKAVALARQEARDLRLLDAESGTVRDLEALIRGMGGSVEQFDGHGRDGSLSIKNDRTWYIYVGSRIRTEARCRFTLAHELGHYYTSYRVDTRKSYSDDARKRWEDAANLFAAIFLMPDRLVERARREICEKPDSGGVASLFKTTERLVGLSGCGFRAAAHRIVDGTLEDGYGTFVRHRRARALVTVKCSNNETGPRDGQRDYAADALRDVSFYYTGSWAKFLPIKYGKPVPGSRENVPLAALNAVNDAIAGSTVTSLFAPAERPAPGVHCLNRQFSRWFLDDPKLRRDCVVRENTLVDPERWDGLTWAYILLEIVKLGAPGTDSD